MVTFQISLHSCCNKISVVFILWLCICLSNISCNPFQFDFGDPTKPEQSNLPTPCTAPNGKKSICVPQENCDQLSALIKNLQKPISADIGKYIKDSFVCTQDTKNKPKREVCCPEENIKRFNTVPVPPKDECTVQNGESGSCVVYSQCRPLLEIISNLRQPLPPQVPRLLQGSILCGFEKVSGRSLPKVCCPRGAVDAPTKETFENHPNRNALASRCPMKPFSQKIVGGENAPIGDYPWLALLGYSSTANNTKDTPIHWHCGGSLIGDRYVVTAAHCIKQELSKIRVGEYTISNTGKDCSSINRHQCNSGHQDFDIEKIISHPEYNSRTAKKDIAIIKLKNKIIQNDFVKPICLPYDDDVTNDYRKTGDALWVAGWGVTGPRDDGVSHKDGSLADTLQHVNMTIYDQTKCKNLLTEADYELEESQLCAGGEAGRDSCFGDSGSALMADYIDSKNRFETWKLIGLVSFGLSKKCGVQGSPGIYTKIRDYIPWILDNVEL